MNGIGVKTQDKAPRITPGGLVLVEASSESAHLLHGGLRGHSAPVQVEERIQGVAVFVLVAIGAVAQDCLDRIDPRPPTPLPYPDLMTEVRSSLKDNRDLSQ